jgi:triacylglycerol lipase
MPQAQMDTRHEVARVCGEPRRRDVKSGHGPFSLTRTLFGVIGRVALVQATEMALMASTAARTPLRLVGATLHPARGALSLAQSRSAHPARPVVLVHGFCGTKSSWSVVARTLSARGLTVGAITYVPFRTSVEQLADQLVAEVDGILSQTGADKVHLVGHSLGGIVIAQAIADGRLNGLVDTVITLGSPFGGSPWANLLPFGEIARAMREDSPLLRRLASAPAPDGVRWLAFTADLDMIVPGVRSVPANAKVETIKVGGVGHLGMLSSLQVVELIVDALPVCDIQDALPA